MMKSEQVVKTLSNVVRGTTPKKHHLSLIVVLTIIYFVGIVVSIWFYPNQTYSPLNNFISDMGGIATNPEVYWVFNTTVILIGILTIPHFIYLYRRFVLINEWLTRLMLISGILGCFGFVCVGLIPEDFKAPHDISALVAFGGFTSAALFTMLIFLIIKSQWISPRKFWILYGPLCITYPLIFIMPNLTSLVSSLSLDLRWFAWPIWEWTFMGSLTYWIIGVAIITPDRTWARAYLEKPKINHPLQGSSHRSYFVFLRRHYIGNTPLESGQ
ncbi:MAG: hypothetical protein RBG13Loki_1586 [Promethearchaeota archaeon CR_4]|nr:MAG: hypothetical protein RBG13Loki_1586 [Candidatus Lokiarchaeota archaeon CR_4]